MSEELERAIRAIREGKLVGMPTETVYGLAADATNDHAVARVFAAKGRPRFDPLIVHVADAERAWTVARPSERARRLAAAFWPGPLTLILPRTDIVSDLVTSGMDTVGVRCPDHVVARALIAGSGRPLAAPSANLFGRVSPTTAEHVREQLGDDVAVILDGGPSRVGVESTVLRVDPEPLILRPGGLSREALEECLSTPVKVADHGARAENLPQEAPGMLASHYAPRVPLELLADRDSWPTDPTVGRLTLTSEGLPPGGPTEVLSSDGDLTEAATRLFSALRALDQSGVESIVAKSVPDRGLGLAINDRLRRAAGLG